MWKVASYALFGLLFFLADCLSSAIAQVDDRDRSSPKVQNTVREMYVGSPNLPDGIAFINALRMIMSLNAEDPETAEALVMDRVRLDTNAAKKFITSLEASLSSFDKKVDERGREILCDNGVPRAYGADGFTLLDAVLSSSDGIAEQHFGEFKESIDKKTAAKLQIWVNESKRSIGHIRFDQKALAQENSVANVDAELSALCVDLNRADGGASK